TGPPGRNGGRGSGYSEHRLEIGRGRTIPKGRPVREADPLPVRFGSRHVLSKGSRHACGAMSWWTAFGPQEPGWYRRMGDGISSKGVDTSHSRSIPSAVVNKVRSSRI